MFFLGHEGELDEPFFLFSPAQVLRYFDYVFTGVFAFEMLIKVNGGERNSAVLRNPNLDSAAPVR